MAGREPEPFKLNPPRESNDPPPSIPKTALILLVSGNAAGAGRVLPGRYYKGRGNLFGAASIKRKQGRMTLKG